MSHTISDELFYFVQNQLQLVIHTFYGDPFGWVKTESIAEVHVAHDELVAFAHEVGVNWGEIIAQRSEFERQRMRDIVNG